MSDENIEISPPPRLKRSSLPKKQVQTCQTTPSSCPTKLPPKPPNVITTTRMTSITSHYKPIGNNRLPPPPHPTHLTSSAPPRTSSSANIVRKNRKNGGSINNQNQEEHIYESVDTFRNKNELRLSTEVQCWPWPSKQSSLPPKINLAKLGSSFKSVSLGRNAEPPPPQKGRTLLQRYRVVAINSH